MRVFFRWVVTNDTKFWDFAFEILQFFSSYEILQYKKYLPSNNIRMCQKRAEVGLNHKPYWQKMVSRAISIFLLHKALSKDLNFNGSPFCYFLISTAFHPWKFSCLPVPSLRTICILFASCL